MIIPMIIAMIFSLFRYLFPSYPHSNPMVTSPSLVMSLLMLMLPHVTSKIPWISQKTRWFSWRIGPMISPFSAFHGMILRFGCQGRRLHCPFAWSFVSCWRILWPRSNGPSNLILNVFILGLKTNHFGHFLWLPIQNPMNITKSHEYLWMQILSINLVDGWRSYLFGLW